MFGNLKKRIGNFFNNFDKHAEKEAKDVEVDGKSEEKYEKEEEVLENEIKDLHEEKELEKKKAKAEKENNVEDYEKDEQKEKELDEDLKQEEKKGVFSGIKKKFTMKKISDENFEELFEELEYSLLENNVSLEVTEKIKEDMRSEIVNTPLKKKEINNKLRETLSSSIKSLFSKDKIDIFKEVKNKKPYVVSFIGVNGSGKTTNLAKVADLIKKKNMSCVMAACDTFRSAAIQQIEEHANNLDIKLIKHDYGADAAAVAYDAISYAKSKNIDFVLLDTAGRLHSNTNLMNELKKIIKIAEPDLNIFVGESTTGNDCVEQAKNFSESIRIDGVFLSKVDVDDSGGAAISISYVTGKPILFIGTGQNYNDIKEFDSEIIIKNLGL
ncbi:MAG: signal recognition particle-docking protein FtsY [Nanobdellota archaeon]